MKTAYKDYNVQQKVLHSKFDIETHKNTFIDYLEVCIDADGSVHYAVPSHSEWMIKYISARDNTSDDDVRNGNGIYHEAFLSDPFYYLTTISGCIAVWNNCYAGKPNVAQIQTLIELRRAGLYKGAL